MKLTTIAATALGVGIALAGPVFAEHTGKNEYMQACAVCHGESGKGMGPLAPLMNVPVPALTTLAKDNDGEFPMLKVIQIIDGRTGLRGHGSVMPIWGDRFQAAAVHDAGDYGAELVVRGRILALAQYLESIQE